MIILHTLLLLVILLQGQHNLDQVKSLEGHCSLLTHHKTCHLITSVQSIDKCCPQLGQLRADEELSDYFVAPIDDVNNV